MTTYDTGKHLWVYNKPIEWDSWDRSPSRRLLGPCPRCGWPTSTYGGSYSCHNDYCQNSASNFICRPDPTPDWWGTDVVVFLDGDTWFAAGEGFVNLQVSRYGFGETPQKAVEDYHQRLGVSDENGKAKTCVTEALIVCPCGKLIDSGPTCKSCAPAYRAGKAENEWQLIETAPRDGEVVDLWHRHGFRVTDTWWDAEDACWSCAMDDASFTHWMPIHTPPTESNKCK